MSTKWPSHYVTHLLTIVSFSSLFSFPLHLFSSARFAGPSHHLALIMPVSVRPGARRLAPAITHEGVL